MGGVLNLKSDNEQFSYQNKVHNNFRYIYKWGFESYTDACKLIENYGPDIACMITDYCMKEQESKDYIKSVLSGKVSDAELVNSLGLTGDKFNERVEAGKNFNDRNRMFNVSSEIWGKQAEFETKCPSSVIIPEGILKDLAQILPKVENGDNNIYMCRAGRVTCIGTTLKYYKNDYEKALGKDLTNTLQIAEDLVDDSKALYYSKDGKTWSVCSKGGAGKALSPLQRRIKGDGNVVYLSSKPGGKGDVIKLSRIAGAGFDLLEVNGQAIRDIINEEALIINVAALETSYAKVMKKIPKSNWNKLDGLQQAWLAYSEFHNPKRNSSAIRQSGLYRVSKNPQKVANDSINTALKNCPNKNAINIYDNMKSERGL